MTLNLESITKTPSQGAYWQAGKEPQTFTKKPACPFTFSCDLTSVLSPRKTILGDVWAHPPCEEGPLHFPEGLHGAHLFQPLFSWNSRVLWFETTSLWSALVFPSSPGRHSRGQRYFYFPFPPGFDKGFSCITGLYYKVQRVFPFLKEDHWGCK